MTPAIVLRVGDVQAGALAVYVLDPAHDIDPEARAFALDGDALRVDLEAAGGADAAARYLIDAANSADASNDRQFRDALEALARRVRTAAGRIDTP